jgi:cell division protein FtsZ
MWMKKLLEQALAHHEQSTGYIPPSPDKNDEENPTILVIGCGSAGCNAIPKIFEKKIPEILTFAIDTDRGKLATTKAHHKICIGNQFIEGNCTEGVPQIGETTVDELLSEISSCIASAQCVFIVLGLGGSAGTGLAPFIARIARDKGALVIIFGFLPLRVERARFQKSQGILESLLATADSVILMDNNKIKSYLPTSSIEYVFTVNNILVAETIASLVDLFTAPPIDCYGGVRDGPSPLYALLKDRGLAVMFAGESIWQNMGESVVRECLSHPMVDIDYRKATGCIIHISGDPALTLLDVNNYAIALTSELHPNTDVIWGARTRTDLEGFIRVFAIMTGVNAGSGTR